MIIKGLSLITAAVILIIYQQSQLNSNDALFLFTSNNIVVNISLIALAVTAVRLSFINKFKRNWPYAFTVFGGVLLSVFGVAGVILSQVDYLFFNVFGPLDFLFLAEIGVIFSVCALSYQHQPLELRLPAIKLPSMPRFKNPLPTGPRFIGHT
jgi:hypothetical protein